MATRWFARFALLNRRTQSEAWSFPNLRSHVVVGARSEKVEPVEPPSFRPVGADGYQELRAGTISFPRAIALIGDESRRDSGEQDPRSWFLMNAGDRRSVLSL